MSERDGGLSAVAATEPSAESTSSPSAPPCLGGLEQLYADLSLVRPPYEPLGVVTVRMPKRLHDALRETAKRERVSINWLCVALLGGFPLHPMPESFGARGRSKPPRPTATPNPV
jgi:hypothetical protein